MKLNRGNIFGGILAILLAGCQASGVNVGDSPFERLSEYGFFAGELKNLQPASDRILPYDLNSPLFTDYAHKARFVYIPEGKQAGYTPTGVLDFPSGSVLIKNFYYPKDFRKPEKDRQLMETRLLIRGDENWEAHDYVWNETQTDAELDVVGPVLPVSWLDDKGEKQQLDYVVPNKNQCKSCHYVDGKLEPIGPKVRNLNRIFEYPEGAQNQLGRWADAGLLAGYQPDAAHPAVAVWDNPGSGTLHERAMAYLDINCGHCHNPHGPANTTGLNLVWDAPADVNIGIRKASVAAGKGTGGNEFNILPGRPDSSILLYRMASTDPAEMMPELGRRLVHAEGVALIRDWISQMQVAQP